MLRLMWVRTWPGMALGVLVLASLFSGCVGPPRARSIIAPDGSAALHISCGADQGACFALAGESCPNGYRLKPIFDPSSNNFLVRCENHARIAEQKETGPSTVVIRALGPAPSGSTPDWPPPPQPWTPTDPWAAGGTASGAGSLPEAARLPEGPIDIGY